MTSSSLPSISYRLVDQKHQSTFSQLPKTSSILFQEAQNRTLLQEVVVPVRSLNQYLGIYEWRNNIQKGIAHCFWTCIFPLDSKNVLIQVKSKFYPFTLKNVEKTSLAQLIYILDEVLTGFEILFKKFGGFKVDDQYIFFDFNYQIQVWASKQIAKNNFNLEEQSQHEFLCQILKILQGHEIRSKLTSKFNQGLRRYQTLTFDILKAYIKSFISQNQMIIGNKNSIKDILVNQTKGQKLSHNFGSKEQIIYSLNFISGSKNQGVLPQSSNVRISPLKSQKQIYLQFSTSKKLRRKGPQFVPARSQNALKGSDMTTQGTQNLSESRDHHICKEEESKEKSFNMNLTNKFELLGIQFRSQSRKKVREIKFNPKSISLEGNSINSVPQREKKQILQTRRQDFLDNYTRDAVSDSDAQESQQNSDENNFIPKELIRNLFTVPSIKRQLSSQEQKNEIFDLKVFEEKISSNLKFFQTIDSLADTKKMTSSIQIEDEKKSRKSPIKLQKLSRMKSKLYESIIQEDNANLEKQIY